MAQGPQEPSDEQIKHRLQTIMVAYEKAENSFFMGCLGFSSLLCCFVVLSIHWSGAGLWSKVGAGLAAFLGATVLYVGVGFGFNLQGVRSARRSFDNLFPQGTPRRRRALTLLEGVSGQYGNAAKSVLDAVKGPAIQWGPAVSPESQVQEGLSSQGMTSQTEAPRHEDVPAPSSRQDQGQEASPYILLEPDPPDPGRKDKEPFAG